MALVAIVDYVQDVIARLHQGTDRPPWSPLKLRILAYACPCMVFARIDNRLDDLELGGDGLVTPECDFNRVCALSCFHTVCCFLCCFSTGRELVWQRERARNFGFKNAERFEYWEATFKPCGYLVEGEEGIHNLCIQRARRRQFYEGYKANEPMRLPVRVGYADPKGSHAAATAIDMLAKDHRPNPNASLGARSLITPPTPLPNMPGMPGMPLIPDVVGGHGLSVMPETTGMNAMSAGAMSLPQRDGGLMRAGPSCQFRTRLDDIAEVESSRASENTLRTSGMTQRSSKLSISPQKPAPTKPPEAPRPESPAQSRRKPSSTESIKRDIRPCVVGISWSKPRKSRDSSSQATRSIIREKSLSTDMWPSTESQRATQADTVSVSEKLEIPAPPIVRHFSLKNMRPSSSCDLQSPIHVQYADIPIRPTSAGTWPRVAPRIEGRIPPSPVGFNHTSSMQAGANNDLQTGGFDIRMYGSGRRIIGRTQSRSSSGVSFFSVAEAL